MDITDISSDRYVVGPQKSEVALFSPDLNGITGANLHY